MPEPATSTRAAPLRVLIVDDAEEMRTLIRFVLSRSPRYQIVGEAADGIEGVSAAAKLRPDLVMLDLSMPRMDGLEAMPMLLAAGCDVIVLSGYAKDAMADEAIAAGALGYIEKGQAPDEILGMVDKFLGTQEGQPAVLPRTAFGREGLADVFSALASQLEITLRTMTAYVEAFADPPVAARVTVLDLSSAVTGLRRAAELAAARRPMASINRIDTAALVAAVVHAQTITLGAERVSVTGQGSICHGDGTTARMIVTELINNALRHGEGKVTIHLDGPRVQVGSVGPLPDVDDPTTLFLPFVGGGSPSAGAGMGLAIAAELAVLAGQRLWLQPGDTEQVFVIEFSG